MISDQPTSWEVAAHQVLASGRVSSFVQDRIVTPSGEEIDRQYVTHPGAVAVIAWDEDADAIAVVTQYRHPVQMSMVEPPAGLLDIDDEPWLTAAQRELAEEAELQAARWDVLTDICTTPGACQESLRIFLARDISEAARPEGFVIEGEEAHMTANWLPRAELVDAVFAGQLQSPTMVAGIMALETARVSGRLDSLRPTSSEWLARSALGKEQLL